MSPSEENGSLLAAKKKGNRMKGPPTPANKYVSAKARKLMQRLTADRTELQHHAWNECWTIKGAYVNPAPCMELVRLCLLTTTLRANPTTCYALTREARMILLEPDLKPTILTLKNRPENSSK